MNLDEQLRAVLSQEAEMTSATRPPDIDGLIGGGRARRRRRNVARAGVAVLAVALIGGGSYGATRLGGADADSAPPIATEPSADASADSGPTPYADTDGPLAPGTYRYGLESDDDRIMGADLTFGTGWTSSGDPRFAEDGRRAAGIIITEPEALPGTTGCVSQVGGLWNETWDEPGRALAASPPEVAQQFTELPGGTVLESPEATEVSGFPATHLRIRVEDRCQVPAVYCLIQDTDGGGHGITYSGDMPMSAWNVVVDLTVVDVYENPIVVAAWHYETAPQRSVDAVTGVRDSIRFVMEEWASPSDLAG